MSAVLVADPVSQEANIPYQMPKPSLPARARMDIDIVAGRADLDGVDGLQCLEEDIVWRLVRSVDECLVSATWVVVVWNDSLGSSQIPLPCNAIVLCRNPGQKRRARKTHPHCTIMVFRDGVRQALVDLMPLLVLSGNYDGLICVDIADVDALLGMGCEIHFRSRRFDDVRDLTGRSFEWNFIDSGALAGMHAGLYMSDKSLFGDPGARSIFERWAMNRDQWFDACGNDESFDISWCAWHDDADSFEFVYAFTMN